MLCHFQSMSVPVASQDRKYMNANTKATAPYPPSPGRGNERGSDGKNR